LAILDGAVLVAHQPEVVGQVRRGLAETALIAEGSRERLGLAKTVENARELAERLQGVAQIEPEIDGALGALPAVGQSTEGRERSIEARRGLLVRAAGERLRPGLMEVRVRLRPRLALEGVVGETLDVVGKPRGIQALDRLRDSRVQRAPRLREKPTVRDLVSQGVLERVLRLRSRARFVEELGAREVLERPRARV